MRTPKWFLKKSLIAYLLLPVSLIYMIVSGVVYKLRKISQKRSKRPVICIGNILAGGVGKTPIVKAIALKLKAPVVMRGYKRLDELNDLGDEATMLKNAGLDVYVGDRLKNIIALDRIKTKTPIIMDDGFQNPTVKKDISILVFDEKIGAGNGFILPAGPLRESLKAIKRADCVLIVRSRLEKAQINFKIPKNIPVFYVNNKTINPAGNKRTIAFAGIGYPKKFFDSLIPKPFMQKGFPDHYQYTDSDINKLIKLGEKENACLVTTEKDWVRLSVQAQEKIQFAPLETEIQPEFWSWLNDKLK